MCRIFDSVFRERYQLINNTLHLYNYNLYYLMKDMMQLKTMSSDRGYQAEQDAKIMWNRIKYEFFYKHKKNSIFLN